MLPLASLFVLTALVQPPGALVIVGGGKMPEAVRREFVRLAGGAKAKLVVIPTASADADDPAQQDSFLEAWRAAGVAEVVMLHTRNRTTADSAEFMRALREATGVWLSGGDQSQLTKAYGGTKTLELIRSRQANGVVVGGTSAGAAVMSDVMITGGATTATTTVGFGFLRGCVVDQHFTQRKRQARLTGVLQAEPSLLGIGIDEATAAVVVNGIITVRGAGGVYFSEGGELKSCTLKDGKQYHIFQRMMLK